MIRTTAKIKIRRKDNPEVVLEATKITVSHRGKVRSSTYQVHQKYCIYCGHKGLVDHEDAWLLQCEECGLTQAVSSDPGASSIIDEESFLEEWEEVELIHAHVGKYVNKFDYSPVTEQELDGDESDE